MNRSFSSQDDAASYLDLQSAMAQNNEKEKLLQRMVEQQVELQQLQERQKALLDAQQRVSKMDFISTQDLQEKLDRLQAVKQRITTLQSILDDAEASAEPTESTSQVVSAAGAGDSAQKDDVANASSLVNDQLEDLYVTVTNLLADIDKMNVLNDMADKQRLALTMSKPNQRNPLEMAKPIQRRAAEGPKPSVRHTSEIGKPKVLPSSLDKSLSPLPRVKLVENSQSVKSRLNLTQSSDGADTSLVERHYYGSRKAKPTIQSPSESSFDETAAMQKPVYELWQEMRRYQAQLAELQERRRELSAYLKENEQRPCERAPANDDRADNSSSFKQAVKAHSSMQKPAELVEKSLPALRHFGDLKSMNVDASTERTNATWGGSTSTSGDESEGSISPSLQGLEIDSSNRSALAQLPDYVETAIYNLWQDLEYHNNFLQLLLDDQKALSVLLENTLSMQKDHHSSVMYGISPDFLIYQLDNCSAQIMVYRKQIVLLHKDLMEIQKQYPAVDVSYGFAKSAQGIHFAPRERSSLNDSIQFSPRKISQSNVSTPSKFYTTENTRSRSQNDSLNKLYQAYQRSPVAFRASEAKSFSSLQVGANPKKSTPESAPSKNLHIVKKSPNVSITKASPPKKEETELPKPASAMADRGTMTVSAIKQQHLSGLVMPDLSDVDSNASGFPLFEALRDTIYSEAATLISQNEARPHFLIELFHELQQLNSDYLRQHCLFVIRDVVNGYIIDTPKGVDGTARKTPNSGKVSAKSESVYTDLISSMKPLYSENTPSESEADSERENLQYSQPPKAPLQYDYALDISNASALTTPISSQEYQGSGDNNVQNPFESDFLGSTVIHLDEALQRVREMERMKQEKEEENSEQNEQEKLDEKPSAQLDAQKLDVKIKEIINKVIPVIKSGNEVCGEEKIEEICSLVAKLVANERLAEPKGVSSVGKSDQQLQTVLNQCLNKFLGYHLNECGEEIIIDISEVLFNELAYIYMIEDYEEVDEDENKVDEAIIQTMVEEECSACDQESQSGTSELNDVSSSTFSSSNTESKDDGDENSNQNIQKVISESITLMEIGDGSVIVDLSVSETKPLTSYGSGEDEEAGSGEEYDQYKEAEDVPTSMQNDKAVAAGEKKEPCKENMSVNGEK